MARTKEYNTTEVIEAATTEFLTKGYKGVSVNDLVKATKLNKHSMYQEFRSKEGLFCACMDHYVQAIFQDFGHLLRKQPLGLANIEAFFRERIRYGYENNGTGCLLITATLEKDQMDPLVTERVTHHWTLQKADMHLCLQAAASRGEIHFSTNLSTLTDTFLTLLIGMVVMMKSGVPREDVEAVFTQTLRTATQSA